MEGNGQSMRRPPPDFKTPPYVTAHPVITYRKLDFLPLTEYQPIQFPSLGAVDGAASSQASMLSRLREYVPFSRGSDQRTENSTLPRSSEETLRKPPSSSLRFVILATDGLWDQISSQDAVALVGAHLSGLRAASVPRSSLNTYAPTRIGDSPGVQGKASPPSASTSNTNSSTASPQNEGPGWTFVDHHPGVHLLRNAFGGADTDKLRRVLSIPPPFSRRFRDDVTVTVVWWEDGRANEAKTENIYLKAKL